MNKLTARKIIQLLQVPTDDRRPIVDRISANAPVTELITALQSRSTPLIRHILCYMLGDRHEQAAVPALVKCLKDRSPSVRDSAADALAKIGDSSAGVALLERFAGIEKNIGVRRMLAAALGAVGHKSAIPLLIQALDDPDESLRGCAAWSLESLHAQEAKGALERALVHELDLTGESSYATERMREALKAISKAKSKKRKVKSR